MLIPPSTHHKNCQSFLSHIQPTPLYQHFKSLLFQWRDQQKTALATIDSFMRIVELVENQGGEMLDELNKCLIKEVGEREKEGDSADKIKILAVENPNAGNILDSVITWLKNDANIVEKQPPVASVTSVILPQIRQEQKFEGLTEQEFISRLEAHSLCSQISRIIFLYRRCIITLSEFKKLLEPIYRSDLSFFNMLFQFAEQTEAKRRKVTIYAPLNELVDQKYPMSQVGNSYILIPDGYANRGKLWKKKPLEVALNRICVSVPLGSQVSFVITRKNEYQQQLFKNQEQKYQIDSNLESLKAAIYQIQAGKALNAPLFQRLISNIYSSEPIFNMTMKYPQVAKNVILPRLKQKLGQLIKCRSKFSKQCEDIAAKNFYKSLDYRCFYFCKNDKKFNCTQRWEKEIQMRKKQVLHDMTHQQQIEDRESLQRPRNYAFNSFDNITKQQFIECRKLQFTFPRLFHSTYPSYPDNQILFLLDFSCPAILNDVFEIALFHCQKKSLMEIMVLKMIRGAIQRRIKKDPAIIREIEGRQQGQNAQINGSTAGEMLNQPKYTKKNYRDINDEFYDLIEQEIQAAHLEDIECPFQGPCDSTFIGTKQCYFFIRYVVTIYQRFLKVKSLSDERIKMKGDDLDQSPSLYQQFLMILIYKLKEQKSFEELMRKVFQQDAFIFFTLDKLITGLTKLVNNISTDSLTFKILKEGVKDYDLEIRKWSEFVYPSITEQLTKVYREGEGLFRFSYDFQNKMMFISAWENERSDISGEMKKKASVLETAVAGWIVEPNKINKSKIEAKKRKIAEKSIAKVENEYCHQENGGLLMKGEFVLINLKRKSQSSLSLLQKQLQKAPHKLSKFQ